MTIIDSSKLHQDETLRTDVCVVGAGPAGIVVALEAAARGLRVSLFESGGFEPELEIQVLAEGKSVGRPYWALQSSRLRALGGTTGHWTGWCRPLDRADFAERSWMQASGWPIGYGELEPYYRRAHRYCELGPFEYSAESWADRLKLRLLPLGASTLQSVIWQFSPPTRFGRRYREALEREPNLELYLHSNAVSIEQSGPDAVDRLVFRRLDGVSFSVRAEAYVLAMGGLENPRLLLASPGTGSGVGNQHDLVGRCFCEHLHTRLGLALCDARSLRGYDNLVHVPGGEPVAVRLALALAPELRERERLFNLGLTLEPVSGELPYRQRHADGVDALFRQLDGARDAALFELFARAEQEPTPTSRVRLGSRRDKLGLPEAVLDWQPSEATMASVRRTVDWVASEFGRAGFGRIFSYVHKPVQLPSAWPQVTGGHHHMGTTRMHPDREHGVVDVDCRVHGTRNLFVAGSSVFPSVGYANPTLTLVALAARLADHLAGGAA